MIIIVILQVIKRHVEEGKAYTNDRNLYNIHTVRKQSLQILTSATHSMNIFITFYRFVFCRTFFHTFNYHLNRLTFRGIGILNSEGNHITGETYFLHKISQLSSVSVIFDVGANTGNYAVEVRNAFPHAKIYGFEPHPKTFKMLKKKEKQYHLSLHNIALGEKNGKVRLWDFAPDSELKDTQPTSTLASTYRDVVEQFHKQKSISYAVQMERLSDFAEKEQIEKIDLLKIDTEGNELSVLRGAEQLLKKKRIGIIQFEFNEMNAYSKTFFKDFVDLLPEYDFYRLMPRGFYPMGQYKPSTHELFSFQNIIAVPKDYKGKNELFS